MRVSPDITGKANLSATFLLRSDTFDPLSINALTGTSLPSLPYNINGIIRWLGFRRRTVCKTAAISRDSHCSSHDEEADSSSSGT